jgi:H+/Cl- antiporter ClcA
LAGLAIGREGPSVQVAAGVMQHARRWLPSRTSIDGRALLVAGGAAGIAAAFNAPLAGVMFAIEELSGRIEARSSGLVISGHRAGRPDRRLGVRQLHLLRRDPRAPELGWDRSARPAGHAAQRRCGRALLAAAARFADGRSRTASAAGAARFPVRFAAACGLAIAVIGLVSGGSTFGSGYGRSTRHCWKARRHAAALRDRCVRRHLAHRSGRGVPGGLFAPSLSIGAGIGNDVARLADQRISIRGARTHNLKNIDLDCRATSWW